MPNRVEEQLNQRSLVAPDHILVATDLTDMDYLMPHVIAQAQDAGTQVTLVHAILPSDIAPLDAGAITTVDDWKIDRDVRMALLGIAHQLELRGVQCKTSTQRGYASEVICEQIHRVNATRLILGTHGRGKVGQLALGSVSHELISKVDIPVFVVGPFARSAVDHAAPRKILHPVSLMGDYRQSFQLALDIAQKFRAELTLLHVLDQNIEKTINPQRTLEWAKHALESLVPDTTDRVPYVHVRVTSGRLAEEILKEAEQAGTDWIVLGTDGGFRPWSFQETSTYRLLTAAKCPVLSLRHEPHRFAPAKNLEEVHFTFPV